AGRVVRASPGVSPAGIGANVASAGPTRRELEPGAPAVLVVEDDRRMAAFLDRALTYAGYRVMMAEDGEHALTAIEAQSPDLVLLDVMLPGIDGLEVARRLRASNGVPILMLTAREG